MDPKTLLIVARSGPARDALATRLSHDGYQVTTSDDARSTQLALEARAPGAIIIDLPADQPRRLLRRLAAHPRLGMIPRFVLSEPLGLDSTALQASAVFERPLDLDHFVRALASLYPKHLSAPAPQVEAAARADRKQENIRAAIDLVQSLPAPVLQIPPPVSTRPSPRAASVAQTFAIETALGA